MAEQRERIVLEVDEKGVATSVSSANREVARLEASFARAGQTAEQRLLAKIESKRSEMRCQRGNEVQSSEFKV